MQTSFFPVIMAWVNILQERLPKSIDFDADWCKRWNLQTIEKSFGAMPCN